jgi:hypothetical protein
MAKPIQSAAVTSNSNYTGTTYYVDVAAGSDRNNGTSASSAFASIQKVDTLHLKAGDTILFHTGETFSGTLTVADSGTATSHITVGSYGGGASPIIATNGDNGVVIAGSYVTVQDVHVTGAAQAGIQITGAHDTVQRTEIDHSGFGVLTEGSYGIFTQNNVHDLHMIVNTPGGNDDCGAVAFAIQGSHNEFSFNNVNNAKAPSYDYGQDGGGFEFWRSSTDTYIHDNVVANSNGFVEAGGLSGDKISNVSIENNTITNDVILGWLHNDQSLAFGCNISSWDIGGNILAQTTGLGSDAALKGSIILHDNFFQ